LTYITSWVIPLVAIERLADGHYGTGWTLTILFFVTPVRQLTEEIQLVGIDGI